jgi:hypothetical protein
MQCLYLQTYGGESESFAGKSSLYKGNYASHSGAYVGVRALACQPCGLSTISGMSERLVQSQLLKGGTLSCCCHLQCFCVLYAYASYHMDGRLNNMEGSLHCMEGNLHHIEGSLNYVNGIWHHTEEHPHHMEWSVHYMKGILNHM